MNILGIETSCDETAVAIYHPSLGILANIIHSQIDTHAPFGGVVPELASRDHATKLTCLVEQALTAAQLTAKDISAIAYTRGPGLIGALMVGGAFAKSLAYAWSIPSIGVHHLEGHLLAPMLEEPAPEFPFIALLVSGGHTQLFKVTGFQQYELLGDTLDDAAGEAFDKTAKLLGLSYPGGPEIQRAALNGTPGRFKFPRPLTDRPGLDFSFSGLKTFALNTIQSTEQNSQNVADIAWAFQDAVVDTLTIKCRRAIQATGIRQLVIAGGVGANQALRDRLQTEMSQNQGRVFYPRLEFCTDNAAMIAFCGYHQLILGHQEDQSIDPRPRWPLSTGIRSPNAEQ